MSKVNKLNTSVSKVNEYKAESMAKEIAKNTVSVTPIEIGKKKKTISPVDIDNILNDKITNNSTATQSTNKIIEKKSLIKSLTSSIKNKIKEN